MTSPGAVTGKIRVVVRAVNGGIEEQNQRTLVISLVSGLYVSPEPNTPRIASFTRVGRKIAVTAEYDWEDSEGFPALLQLFVWVDGTSADYTTPQATKALVVARNGKSLTSIDYTVGADGFYWVGVRVATLSGIQDSNTDKGQIYLSIAVPASPTNYSQHAGRG